jgi:hypothetical protein
MAERRAHAVPFRLPPQDRSAVTCWEHGRHGGPTPSATGRWSARSKLGRCRDVDLFTVLPTSRPRLCRQLRHSDSRMDRAPLSHLVPNVSPIRSEQARGMRPHSPAAAAFASAREHRRLMQKGVRRRSA